MLLKDAIGACHLASPTAFGSAGRSIRREFDSVLRARQLLSNPNDAHGITEDTFLFACRFSILHSQNASFTFRGLLRLVA
jgi:hypothetical protein